MGENNPLVLITQTDQTDFFVTLVSERVTLLCKPTLACVSRTSRRVDSQSACRPEALSQHVQIKLLITFFMIGLYWASCDETDDRHVYVCATCGAVNVSPLMSSNQSVFYFYVCSHQGEIRHTKETLAHSSSSHYY